MTTVVSFVLGAVAGFSAAALYARKRYARLRMKVEAVKLAGNFVADELDMLYLMPSAAGINWEDFDDD